MAKTKGIAVIVPSILIVFLELYFLIIEPILDDKTATIDSDQYWALAIPVFIITMVIGLIMLWIGYTMIVTKEPIRMTYDSAYEEAAGEIDWLEEEN